MPEQVTLVAAANPEAVFLANLSLDRTPPVPRQGARQNARLWSGPKAYTGVVYGYKLRHCKDISFFSGRTGSVRHAEQLLSGLAGLAGYPEMKASSKRINNGGLTLTALYAPGQEARARQLLDSLVAAGPGPGTPARGLAGLNGGLALQVPNLAALLDSGQDSSLLNGRFSISANLIGKISAARFAFEPAGTSPLSGNPVFQPYTRLNPWNGFHPSPGMTELVMGIRKEAVMAHLQKDRRYRVLELMGGFLRIPVEELITSAGSDVYFAGDSGKAAGYSVTALVQDPARMKQALGRMAREGSLSGPGNRNLLGSRTSALYTHGGLLTFQYKNGAYPKAFGRRDNVSLALRANPAFIRAMAILFMPKQPTHRVAALDMVRRMDMEMLNREDGSFTGSIRLEHNLDLVKMADKI